MTQEKGSLIVEMLYVCWFWSFLIALFFSMGRWMVDEHRALTGVRMATVLLASGLVTDTDIDLELRRFYSTVNSSTNPMWSWRLGRFTESASSRFYHLVGTQVTLPSVLPISERLIIQKEDIE